MMGCSVSPPNMYLVHLASTGFPLVPRAVFEDAVASSEPKLSTESKSPGPWRSSACVSKASVLIVRFVCSVFVMTSDCALGSLQAHWTQTDASWSLDTPLGRLWVSMISECCVELGNVRLEVALHNKTFWPSSEDNTGRTLVVNGVSLPWSPTLEFIGKVFDLCGHKSAEHRQHKANGVFRRWAPLLTNLSLPNHERMQAFRISVAHSALYLAGCWRTLTKTQSSKLGSCRRRPDETPVKHWRLCHRVGHALAENFGLDLSQHCLLQKHRFADDLARSEPEAHRTLATRDLAWWGDSQAAHARLKYKWGGVHSQRFNVWRWETPLETFYGRARR